MFNDYEKFKKEFKRYEGYDWDSVYHDDQPKKKGAELLKIVEGYGKLADIKHPYDQTDMVNTLLCTTGIMSRAIDHVCLIVRMLNIKQTWSVALLIIPVVHKSVLTSSKKQYTLVYHGYNEQGY